MTFSNDYPDAVEHARKLMVDRGAVKRDVLVHLRVTKGERAMLRRMADQNNENMSSFIRNAALDVARALIEFDGGEPEA